MAALEFVSITHPDEIKIRETRRRIGQHVMKNIGYARRKAPLRKSVRKNRNEELEGEEHTGDNSKRPLNQRDTPDTPSAYQPEDDFKRSPFTALSRNLAARSARIDSLLTRESSPMCKSQRELYYTMALLDDGAFQLALADAVLHELVQPVGRFMVIKENALAMQHYTACVSFLNQGIRNGGEASQNLMGTVIALASYDLTVRNFGRWSTHMKGLKSMIQVRGGYASVGSKYIQNAMLWTDMCGSLNIDSHPHFGLESSQNEFRNPSLQPSDALPMALARCIAVLQHRSPSFTDLCVVLRHLSQLALMVPKVPSKEWMQDTKVVQAITKASHMVLNLPRQGERPEHDNEGALYEIFRLAALLFVIGPVCTLSDEKDIMLGKVGCLPALLRAEIVDWTGLEELELWVLFLGARIEDGEDRDSLVSRICRRLKALGLDVKALDYVLHDIVWVDQALEEDTDLLKREIGKAMMDHPMTRKKSS